MPDDWITTFGLTVAAWTASTTALPGIQPAVAELCLALVGPSGGEEAIACQVFPCQVDDGERAVGKAPPAGAGTRVPSLDAHLIGQTFDRVWVARQCYRLVSISQQLSTNCRPMNPVPPVIMTRMAASYLALTANFRQNDNTLYRFCQ